MKKCLPLGMLFLMAAFPAMKAQTTPKKGSFSTEIQVNPFDQSGQTFAIDGLKLRYFFNEKHALRLNLGLNGIHSNYTYDTVVDEETNETASYDYKARSTTFNLDLGYERHFLLGKRTDFYVGAEVGLSKRFAKTTATGVEKSGSVRYTLENAYLPEDFQQGGQDGDIQLNDIPQDRRANLAFSAAALAGVDVYLYKGLYIGTELNFSVNNVKTNQLKLTSYTRSNISDGSGSSSSNETTIVGEDTYRTTDWGFHIEPHIRLGWTF